MSLETETASENKEKSPAAKLPVVYQFPSDGALLMPEVPDDENAVHAAKPTTANDDTRESGSNDDTRGTKRRHSTVPDEEEAHRRK